MNPMPDARVVLTHPDGTQEFSHTTVEAILAALARGDEATATRLAARFRIATATTDYDRWLLDTKLTEACPTVGRVHACLAGLAGPVTSHDEIIAEELLRTGVEGLRRTPQRVEAVGE